MYRHGLVMADKGRVPRRILWVLAVLVLLLVMAVVAVRIVYYDRLKPVSDSQQVEIVTIESGTSSVEIADMLAERRLIQSSAIFQWYIRTNDARDKLQAGTYALRPSMSVPQIVEVLISGSVKSELVTFLPGQRLDQIRQAMINAGFAPEAVDRALDPAAYASHPALSDKPAEASLEGFLYPESYSKTANTDPGVIINQALDQMAKRLTPDVRAAFAARGLSVFQGVTMASMVEEEVSKPADRAQAAQVFHKRLQIDMPLGSDPTAFYGAIMAGKEVSTTFDSPYNTLLHKGLPPGPIANMTESSLQAVANPAATDWLYFVSGDDGTTHFSKTFEEHENLIRQYCREQCAPVD